MKYKLTENKIEVNRITLYQIECVMAFNNVSAGDKGGYIEKLENLSQDGNAWVSGDARVYGNADILWISKIGSRLDTTTVFKIKGGGVGISCGCFLGTLEEFETKVRDTHKDNKFGKEYKALIGLIKIHFNIGG